MGDIMGFFIELILDIFFEGSMELATNGKLPKWIRIIAGIILLLVFIGIVGLFLYLAYESLQEGQVGASILCFILAIICVIFFSWGFMRKYHKKNK